MNKSLFNCLFRTKRRSFFCTMSAVLSAFLLFIVCSDSGTNSNGKGGGYEDIGYCRYKCDNEYDSCLNLYEPGDANAVPGCSYRRTGCYNACRGY